MSGMLERIWLHPNKRFILTGAEQHDNSTIPTTEYVRADIVEAKDAEIERLRNAMERAEGLMTQYANVGFYGWLMTQGSDSDPTKKAEEAIACLRERDNRPPSSGVQSGVQGGEGDAETA